MAKNIASNLVGALVPLAITLFTVPIYLHHVGAARYGVILVAWSLLGYFGFMDLGISRATTNALAKIADGGASDEKDRVFWSSFIINGCLGLVGGVILYFAGSYLFLHVMKISPDLHAEIAGSVPYIACMLPLALMMGVGVGTAEAHEKFPTLNLIQSIGLILGQVLPLSAVLLFGPSLLLIMPIMLGVRFLTFAAITLFAMRVGHIQWRPIVDIPRVKALFAFGGWVTVTNLVGPIMTNADQFVIGSLRSIAVVPSYAVPMNIITRTQILPTMLTRTLFPVFSRVEHLEGRALVGATLAHLSTITTLVYVGGIFLADPFFRLWLGADMAAQTAPVFALLALGAWWNCLAFIVYSALQGQGRPRTVATIHAIEVLPYVALLLMLVHWYGVVGAAIAWSLRAAIDSVLLAWAFKVDRATALAIAPGFAALLVAFAATWLLHPGLIGALVGTALVAIGFLGASHFANPHFKAMLAMLPALRNRMAGSRA